MRINLGLPTIETILPYFPRGSGPLVSVLIPTRGRPKGLATTVDSLYSLAQNKSNLEFIFKVDDDDKETIDLTHNIANILPNCKIICSPRGRGYLDLHVWVNQMCSIASGDWLFLMNDDAVMVTQNWDGCIEVTAGQGSWPGINELCLLTLSEMNHPYSIGWYMLRRQTYELLGHFSMSPLCADWLWRVMNCCGIRIHITQVCIHHNSLDDTLKRDNLKVNDQAIRNITSLKETKTRMDSVVRITNRMSWFESRRRWSRFHPSQEGWVLWKESSEGYTKDVYFKDSDNILYVKKGDKGEELISIKQFKEMNGFWTAKE